LSCKRWTRNNKQTECGYYDEGLFHFIREQQFTGDSHSCQHEYHNACMSHNIKCRLAKRLKQLRTKEGYSVPELAKRSGVSRQHIRDLELSHPEKRATVVTLEKLARGLKVPTWKLLLFKD